MLTELIKMNALDADTLLVLQNDLIGKRPDFNGEDLKVIDAAIALVEEQFAVPTAE